MCNGLPKPFVDVQLQVLQPVGHIVPVGTYSWSLRYTLVPSFQGPTRYGPQSGSQDLSTPFLPPGNPLPGLTVPPKMTLPNPVEDNWLTVNHYKTGHYVKVTSYRWLVVGHNLKGRMREKESDLFGVNKIRRGRDWSNKFSSSENV